MATVFLHFPIYYLYGLGSKKMVDAKYGTVILHVYVHLLPWPPPFILCLDPHLNKCRVI